MKDEKRQSFDEFKDKVYEDIKFLEFLEKDIAGELKPNSIREGCFKMLFVGFLERFHLYSLRKLRETKKIDELSNQAYDLLAREDIKKRLCDKLSESVRLPIDAANSISPILYEIAKEGDLPFDTMLWALISRKIIDRGANDYCN